MSAIVAIWFHRLPEDGGSRRRCASTLKRLHGRLGTRPCSSISSCPAMKGRSGFRTSLASRLWVAYPKRSVIHPKATLMRWSCTSGWNRNVTAPPRFFTHSLAFGAITVNDGLPFEWSILRFLADLRLSVALRATRLYPLCNDDFHSPIFTTAFFGIIRRDRLAVRVPYGFDAVGL